MVRSNIDLQLTLFARKKDDRGCGLQNGYVCDHFLELGTLFKSRLISQGDKKAEAKNSKYTRGQSVEVGGQQFFHTEGTLPLNTHRLGMGLPGRGYAHHWQARMVAGPAHYRTLRTICFFKSCKKSCP